MTLSAVLVAPPDAVSVRAMLVLPEKFERVFAIVAAVLVPMLEFVPPMLTLSAIGLVAVVLPVTDMSNIFPVVSVDDAR